MFFYLLQRSLVTLITLFLLLTLVFVAVRLSGDPEYLLIPADAPPEDAALVRASLGLDQPYHVQYARYFGSMLQGDFGDSYAWHGPAMQILTDRLPATLQLSGAAFVIAFGLSIPAGIIAAIYQGSWIDVFSRLFAAVGQAVPEFWLAILAILVFGVWLEWLPIFGRGGLEHLILPALVLSISSMAGQMRVTRSVMLDVLDSDYVRMARLKGLREQRVILVHALRNASIPIVTLLGVRLGRLISGAVLVEVVFAWPGIGRVMVEAVSNRDFPVVQAGVLLFGVSFIIANFVVDMTYAALDPRVRG